MCDGQKSTYAEDADGSLSARAMGHMAATRQAGGYGDLWGRTWKRGGAGLQWTVDVMDGGVVLRC